MPARMRASIMLRLAGGGRVWYNARAMTLASVFTAWESIENMPAFLQAAAMIILGLILIEGLLSVDNALGIAAMASHLPKHQQRPALRWGIVGAYVFRALALVLVGWLMHNMWVKWFGAAYLIYLGASHLQLKAHVEHEDAGALAAKTAGKSFLMTIASIELMDLSLSIDNVVAAVGMVNGVKAIPEELHIWVVCLGVFIGIAALRLVAGWCIGIIEKYPILGYTAFVLVGFVGFALCLEMGLECAGIEWHMGIGLKFSVIVAVVALSIAYQIYPHLHRFLHPPIYVFRWICSFFVSWVEGILFFWRHIPSRKS